jgi:hypothetical protein
MEDKAKVITLKRKKQTNISKSGKGVVVRKPEKNKPISEDEKVLENEGKHELLPWTKQTDLTVQQEASGEFRKLEILENQGLKLDQIEKDLVEVKKNKTFIEELLGIDPADEEIEHLEKVSKKLNLRIEVRNALSTLIKQQHELERNLLELKTSLLQKKALSQFAVQKLINEIELDKLAIEKAKHELEKLELQKEIQDLKRQLQSGGKTIDQQDVYSLKDLNTLEEIPDTGSDEE